PARPPLRRRSLGRRRRWWLPDRERRAPGLDRLLRGAERPGGPPRGAVGVAQPRGGAERVTPPLHLPGRSRAAQRRARCRDAPHGARQRRATQAPRLRPARSALITAMPRVLLTGVASELAGVLAQRLERDDRIHTVVG